MNQRVHKAMEHWLDAIKLVQDRRKKEIGNATKRQNETLHYMSIHDDKGKCQGFPIHSDYPIHLPKI